MKQDMASFVTMMRRVWNEWELRTLVLISLLIQILLVCFASVRKHRVSKTISLLVWSCYLLADSVATLALGVLAKTLLMMNNNNNSTSDGVDVLKAFWAPFLLLHLGGPDNITAFSLEDNELWLRHLVGLLFQVGTAIYIFIISSFPAVPSLSWLIITLLMLIGGTIKYVERTLALMNASQDHFRNSKSDYRLDALISFHREPESQQNINIHEEGDSSSENIEEGDSSSENINDIELRWKAHMLFQVFKRLIVDPVMSFYNQGQSETFFKNSSWDKAYKVIEIELGFLYEVLYTKAAVVRTWMGWILRFTSISSIIAVSIIFFAFIDQKQTYDKIDLKITWVLLSGAIALELWSLMTRSLFTDWTIAWMIENNFNPFITRFVFKVVSYKRQPNCMAQYNLINFCLKDHKPSFWGKAMESIHMKDLFNKHWYRTYKEISEKLKIYIFKELRKAAASESHERFGITRGQWALQSRIIDGQEGRQDRLANQIRTNSEDDKVILKSIKAEFEESILLWHIATDTCYYLDGEENQSETVMSNQRISRDISNYMLYLLVSHPSMLTAAGMGQIRFWDTCAEAKYFFRQRKPETNDLKEACISLHQKDRTPNCVGLEPHFSVLERASKLANALLKQVPEDIEKRWKMISQVWLEMLCYAANECRGYHHAQRLGAGGGGELLTVVWFLMAHLNLGKQFLLMFG